MIFNKAHKTSVFCASLLLFPITSNAVLHIVTDSDRPLLPQSITSNKSDLNVVFIGNEKIENEVKADFTDLPIELALQAISPRGWKFQVDELTDLSISWAGSKDWLDVIADVAKENSLKAKIDFNRKLLTLKRRANVFLEEQVGNSLGGVSDLDSSELQSKIQSPSFVSPNLLTNAQRDAVAATDKVIVCEPTNETCEEGKVDIEKLVLDTSWVVEASNNENKSSQTNQMKSELSMESYAEYTGVTAKEAANSDNEFDKKLEQKQKEKEGLMKADYSRSYVLHGSGSFADFVNGGGFISKDEAVPEVVYTYVYKQGTLFQSIDKWAQANGYRVKNDILTQQEKDYPNISDVRIKGTFFGATTALLDKYKHAEYPVNHKFYIQGKVLHIFAGKYN